MQSEDINITELYYRDMEVFVAKAKKWGNSLGFVIPKNIVEDEQISTEKSFRVMILPSEPLGKRIWGKVDFDKPTEELRDRVERDVEK